MTFIAITPPAEGMVSWRTCTGASPRRAILYAVLTVASLSFVNRLVLGTRVELEPGFEQSCDPEFRGSADGRKSPVAPFTSTSTTSS